MNQILQKFNNKNLIKKIYIIQFALCLVLFIAVFLYFIYQKKTLSYHKKVSDITLKSSSISKLYSKNQNTKYLNLHGQTYVLGVIEIPKLNIKYPIFSNYSDELLKISVCKFYGPHLNQIGNFCILGHNYNTDEFFSKINLLKAHDIIYIYDNTSYNKYLVYSIYEVDPEDLSYLQANFFKQKELTLITCNNMNR